MPWYKWPKVRVSDLCLAPLLEARRRAKQARSEPASSAMLAFPADLSFVYGNPKREKECEPLKESNKIREKRREEGVSPLGYIKNIYR